MRTCQSYAIEINSDYLFIEIKLDVLKDMRHQLETHQIFDSEIFKKIEFSSISD